MEKNLYSTPVLSSNIMDINIPFVGDNTAEFQTYKPISYVNPLSLLLPPEQRPIDPPEIKNVSKKSKFGNKVMKKDCSDILPYDGVEIMKVYDFNDVVSSSEKEAPDGRFDARQFLRKVPCQFKKMSLPRAAFIHRRPKSVTERHGEIPPRDYNTTEVKKNLVKKRFFQSRPLSTRKSVGYPLATQYYMPKEKREKSVIRHDENVLSKLNKDTARWIVFNNVESGPQKERLNHFLQTKFGSKISTTNLVRENAKECNIKALERRREENEKRNIEEKKQQQKLDRKNVIQNHPTLQQTFAQYYKLPRYLSQEKRKVRPVKSEVNQTAMNITVKHLEPPPPIKMEDILNPAAKNYIYATDNAFEQQLFTNQAKPVFQLSCDRGRIIMDDFSEYRTHIQDIYPPSYTIWSQGTEKKTHCETRPVKHRKGMRRWTSLPQSADFASERGLNLPKTDSTKAELFDPSSSSTMLNNAPLAHIVEVWRSKWKLASSWQEATMGDILMDLDNIHGPVRLAAVAACAMAALHKIPVEDIVVFAVLPKIGAATLENKNDVGHLFVGLLEKVRLRLRDPHGRVQLAAAMCLFSLSEIDDEVTNILEYNLENGIPTDRSACAQCLALNGSKDARVVHLIIQMLLETDEQQQATALLVHLSRDTNLVHSLLGEQLNNGCWKDRVIAINVLSKLCGNINRDLVHKISTLMWEDWSSEVRKAASKALGRTGHGLDIHFELREKLAGGNERVCADVLRKIAHLGIMTATLLPEYLKCFNMTYAHLRMWDEGLSFYHPKLAMFLRSRLHREATGEQPLCGLVVADTQIVCSIQAEYTSVRLECVRTATQLKITDSKVVRELLQLTQFDPAWKVKAHAIKAIGEIGVVSKNIKHVLVWALRFEDEPGVRLEACIAIKNLGCNDHDVILVLQDRVLVESVQAVKDEVKRTLESFGMSGPEDNMVMTRYIKTEVKKLCRKSIVTAKVLSLEQENDSLENIIQSNILNEESASENSDFDLHTKTSRAWAKIAARNSNIIIHGDPSDSMTPANCSSDRTMIINVPRKYESFITEETTSLSNVEIDDRSSDTTDT